MREKHVDAPASLGVVRYGEHVRAACATNIVPFILSVGTSFDEHANSTCALRRSSNGITASSRLICRFASASVLGSEMFSRTHLSSRWKSSSTVPPQMLLRLVLPRSFHLFLSFLDGRSPPGILYFRKSNRSAGASVSSSPSFGLK